MRVAGCVVTGVKRARLFRKLDLAKERLCDE